ncbi:MAG: phosphoenolpyruvate--protein phosphotransferase [Gammaproteobacteria bacterium]|nr:phosphoenolpyruvate--protein phosphotransferase [Gammaproteobacteria bacterium]
MLNTLRSIIQDVNSARDLDQALSIIVQRIREAMGVDVCSIYLTDEKQQQHVLMATQGLKPESVGKVRLAFNTGLISLVAARAEPLNLADAQIHPHYHHSDKIGMEQFHAFLGVPIIHHRKVLGVLVVRQTRVERFDEEHENFLITMAAQLAGAMAHAKTSGETDILLKQHDPKQQDARPLKGLPGAPGVAIGTAVHIYPSTDLDAIPDRKVGNIQAEIDAFHHALSSVKQDLTMLSNRLREVLPSEERRLFDAYLLMLDSHSLRGATATRIMEGNWAAGALRATIEEQVKVFLEMDDAYLRERAEDLRELARRILHYLLRDETYKREFPEHTVLVGEEITAPMLGDVPTERLRGIVAARGSRTSHVAILARALGVPAVMGAEDLPVHRIDGSVIIADGYNGNVYISPPLRVITEFERLAKEEAALAEDLLRLADVPSQTQDGNTVPLYANTGLLADINPSLSTGADGIGLYRTEFPFMIRQRFPGEEEQMRVYRQVLHAFAPKPVVLRTLDIGGDKALPYFPIKEDNPFLGWRGIRITLDHPEIFIVQVRAMLRASAGVDNLYILLPMISRVSELDDSLTLIRRAHQELNEEGNMLNLPKIGVMIEVPSAVYLAENLARRVDFLSIGTNDLTQYLLAVDRNNARVAELYDSLHPAVLLAVNHTIRSGHAANKPVSVCGEMAADPVAAALLVGMGIDSLSMSTASLNRVKWVIRNLTMERARGYVEAVLQMEDAQTVRDYMNGQMESMGLGGLVRAGR